MRNARRCSTRAAGDAGAADSKGFDGTVEELITYYRGVSGEHDNWDEYRAAMVADRRLVVRFRPEHAYGQMRG